jgi:hypothetical protein
LGFNSSQYSNFVNREKNETQNYAPSIQLAFDKHKDKKYNINYWGNINYNVSTSSINKELQTKYWSQSHNLDFTVYFMKKFELNNNVNATLQQKTDLFTKNNNVVVWNAYIGRKFLKNDKGLLKFYVYDVLNQNKGYNRSINTNVITETNYNTVNRYFMISFVWNFSKTAAGMPVPGQ